MKIYWLLIFVPVSIAARLLSLSPTIIFVTSFLGMIPLAALIGETVDVLALYTGPSVGALLTATFGTLIELLILFNLLRLGEFSVMQAEITGSVLLGLVFIIGLSEVVGGLKNGLQEFDSRSVALATSLMALAVIGMIVPTIFSLEEQFRIGNGLSPNFQDARLDTLSRGVSVALIILYVLYLIFIFRNKTARTEVTGREADPTEKPKWSFRRTLGILLAATLMVAVVSTILTDELEPFGAALGLSTLFLGIIILPIAGGFADILVSVRAARNNKIDLTFSLNMSAVLQTALFVAPLMVLLSPLFGTPFTLSFGFVELVAMTLAVAVVSLAANDRIANWLEGAQFLTLYIVLALWFYLVT